jgi:adenylylsulfate kinase-like enzyme
MILLLFGQPASGKTTLGKKIAHEFAGINIDGDKWRDITDNKDYSREGRARNLINAFNMALYLESEGHFVVISMVAPYKEQRDYLRSKAAKLLSVYLEYDGSRGRDERFVKDFEVQDDEEGFRLNTSNVSIESSLILIKTEILKSVWAANE